jgi:hypothetical protein
MGYYTDHTITLKQGEVAHDKKEEIRKALDEISDGYNFENNSDGGELEITLWDAKWYSHEEDMRELSKKYPDLVFQIKGEGEESGDLWIEYYKNGKMQEAPAKIVYDDFDETKLA